MSIKELSISKIELSRINEKNNHLSLQLQNFTDIRKELLDQIENVYKELEVEKRKSIKQETQLLQLNALNQTIKDLNSVINDLREEKVFVESEHAIMIEQLHLDQFEKSKKSFEPVQNNDIELQKELAKIKMQLNDTKGKIN